MTRLHSAVATDVGCVRSANQDRAVVEPRFCAVADGMGGHQGGEVAAQMAIETLRRTLGETQPSGELLREAVREANHAVWERSLGDDQLRGMGTTLTVLALVGEDGHEHLALANVGDSRAYLWRTGTLSQVTADHSLVQDLVRAGRITESQAAEHPGRHILTRALGVDSHVDVDMWNFQPMDGDRFLLCSDGLVNEVDDTQIARILLDYPQAEQAARALVDAAKVSGGNDNITVVIVDIEEAASVPLADVATASAAMQRPSTATGAGHVDGAGPVQIDVPSPGRDTSPGRTRGKRSGRTSGGDPGRRRITLRVVLFVLVLVLLFAGAVGAILWYDHSSYFVTLRRKRVVIDQGRAGGLLWIRPRTVVTTNLTESQLLKYHIPSLEQGVQEPSLAAAKRFVSNLAAEPGSLPLPSSGAAGRQTTGTTATPAAKAGIPAGGG